MNCRDYSKYLPESISSFVPDFIEYGRGSVIHAKNGKEYIDFSGGWGCKIVGYGNPKVTEAVKTQAERFLHTDYSAIPYESFPRLAARLSALVPGPTKKKATFFNSGAEAVENAVKFAKSDTGRKALVAFEHGFHGRTLLAMSLTHKSKPYKAGFGPFASDIYRLPYPNTYRATYDLADMEHNLKTLVDPEEVAAVILEPIVGEGGFLVPPDEFLPKLREITDKYGIDLVLDEIQTGLGRTGKFFATEHFNIEPDITTVAKPLAAGLPLSGVIGKEKVMDAPPSGSIGGTFVGNPVAISAAHAVLDVIEEENLLQKAKQIGEILTSRFHQMQKKFNTLGDVRGLGAMKAIELVKDKNSKEPAPDVTKQVVNLAKKKGVILPTAGLHGNVIRILTPLVIEEEVLKRGLDLLEESLAEAETSLNAS